MKPENIMLMLVCLRPYTVFAFSSLVHSADTKRHKDIISYVGSVNILT